MNNDCVAELEGVSKHYGKLVALDTLDLQVRKGELLAVLGPNGAGKTTAISLMLGLLPPNTGNVRLFGQSPYNMEAKRKVGVMMQEVFIAQELTVREHINLTASYYPAPYGVDEVLSLTHTTPLAKRRYGQLSGGLKRQTQFAMAVCGRPQLLFLDEPTAGLDVQARETLWQTVRELISHGTSIVLTTHYLEEAEALADRVVVINKGRMVTSGTVDEIRGVVLSKRISCTTTLAAEEVESWPDVENVTRDKQQLNIATKDAEAVVRRLLATDENLSDLEISRAGLNEAFTELTQETKK